MLPWADAQAMQMHVDEISRHVARKAHAVVLMDRAGWHTTGKLKGPKGVHHHPAAIARPGAEPG